MNGFVVAIIQSLAIVVFLLVTDRILNWSGIFVQKIDWWIGFLQGMCCIGICQIVGALLK